MKTTPESFEFKKVSNIVKNVNGVRGVEEIYIHYFGPYSMINVCILVDG